MTQRFEVKKQDHWEVRKEILDRSVICAIARNERAKRFGFSRAVFNSAMNTAKKISSERELRRLQWGI